MSQFDPTHRAHAETASSQHGQGVAPGKQTLVQQASWQTAHAPAQPSRTPSPPIQAQPDPDPKLDPAKVQVDQYQPGTDTDRFNDCGPAMVLMVLRAMNVEPAFKQLVADHNKIAKRDDVTLQQELTYIRSLVSDATSPKLATKGEKVDQALEVGQIRNALIAILHSLGSEVDSTALTKQLVTVNESLGLTLTPDEDSGKDKYNTARFPQTKGAIKQFLDAHCGGGSAVIVLGKPTDAAWGWGGTDEGEAKNRRNDGAPIGDTRAGKHYVLVWSPAKDVYTVMDPSWKEPRENQQLDNVLAFIQAKGGDAPVNLIAVPFADLAAQVSVDPANLPAAKPIARKPAGGGAPTADPGAAAAGSPERLPIQTQQRMERVFGLDLSMLRVFQGGRAAAVGANAFAQGSELHFAPGQYRPGTPAGDRLIGHEIAHVAQQREGRVATPAGDSAVVDHPGLEAEADRLGERAAAGDVAPGHGDAAPGHAAGAAPAAAVQRDPDGDGGPTPEPGTIEPGTLQIVVDAFKKAAAATPGEASALRAPAVAQLWSYCQEHIPKPDELHPYAQSNVVDATKRATLGKIAARRARLEFLIGWLVPGGLHDTPKNWEDGSGQSAEDPTGKFDKSSNAGTIVSGYTDAYGARHHDWCGQFVGFCLGQTGMDVPKPGVDSAHWSLLSAYRANHWITDPKRVKDPSEVLITPADLLGGKATPQAGDVIVWADHIAMVEAYDSGTISTVEGNIGVFPHDYANGVGGSAESATDLVGLHGGLLEIWRPGLPAMGATSTATAAQTTDNSQGDAIVTGIESACHQVGALYAAFSLPGAIGDGKTVAAMVSDSQPAKK